MGLCLVLFFILETAHIQDTIFLPHHEISHPFYFFFEMIFLDPGYTFLLLLSLLLLLLIFASISHLSTHCCVFSLRFPPFLYFLSATSFLGTTAVFVCLVFF